MSSIYKGIGNLLVWAKAQINKAITYPALKGGVIENQTISGL